MALFASLIRLGLGTRAMDSESVSGIIAAELATSPAGRAMHGIEVQKCLVEPSKLLFENSFQKGEMLELWLVLKELPAEDKGYLVVFDERSGEFGLAIHGHRGPVFIGCHGSFIDTLNGM